MQHPDILKTIETSAHVKDHNWLIRAKALLQSDCWSTDIRLDDQPDDEAMLAERDRLQSAIEKIEGLILTGATL